MVVVGADVHKRTHTFVAVDEVGKNNTGTTVRFWPDPQFFETVTFSVPKLKHVLRAKAVLCPGLRVTLKIEQSGEKDEWFYTGGVNEYLLSELGQGEWLPPEMFTGSVKADNARDLLAQSNIDGALVGAASLDIEAFAPILRVAEELARTG